MHPMIKYQMTKERIDDLKREAGRVRIPKHDAPEEAHRDALLARFPRLARIRLRTAR